MKKLLLIVIILALLASAVWLLQAHDRSYLSSEESVRELMYFPTAQAVRLLAAGNELVAADYLWLRMIQYYAYHMRRDQKYEYLFPIIDRLTDLDPRFVYPYTFGALLLVHDAQDSIQSLKLLDKAKRLNPDRWEFPYMKGFILYTFLRRDEEAALQFVEASKKPNAWEGALRFAGWIYRKTGRREVSKAMWQELFDTAKDPLDRAVAEYYLRAIAMEEELERLNSLAARFRSEQGRWPSGFRDLMMAELLSEIPKEPFGRKYYWDLSSNTFKSQTRLNKRVY
jgi:tetratricopeptide (TPR) repeat protein